METGEIQRVGSDQVQTRVDVRVIAATNRVLVESVAAKTFREDLYYRLNVIHLQVPPLRERRDDIPVLLRHFLDLFSRQYQIVTPVISKDALDILWITLARERAGAEKRRRTPGDSELRR